MAKLTVEQMVEATHGWRYVQSISTQCQIPNCKAKPELLLIMEIKGGVFFLCHNHFKEIEEIHKQRLEERNNRLILVGSR